jgi:hypothetical protein
VSVASAAGPFTHIKRQPHLEIEGIENRSGREGVSYADRKRMIHGNAKMERKMFEQYVAKLK